MSEISIKSILLASDAVIASPSKSLKDFGINYLVNIIPFLFIGKKIYDFIKSKKEEQEEKERMYREIIAKQQAAIKKQQEINRTLETKLRDANSKNDRNQKEVQRLREQIKHLEEVINLLGRTAKQVA